MEAILEGLSAAQREAVTATEGYIRVAAGAGAGKTRALTRRYAWLVEALGIRPGHILCVTFTNKAAAEMRRRIHNLTGDSDTGYINTFHGFCVSVLQEDIHILQYPKSFLVLDNSDIDAMLRIVYDERGLTLRDMTFSAARDMIEIQKTCRRPDYFLDMLDLSPAALEEKYRAAEKTDDIIFYGYLCRQKQCFGLDYNDLIKLTLCIFSRSAEVRLKWQKRLEYIMIDEFQDIDPLQYELMEALCGYHKNLFIVGDPDQTVYTWRGADVRLFINFERAFPGTRTVMMMENYRSTPEIIAAANSLISKNSGRMEKELIPTLPSGAPVLCRHADSPEDEAAWLAGRLRALHEAGGAWRDSAVLYRAHYLTRPVEEALIKEKIPYTIYSGVQFFERAEVKDALSYLRMLAYRDDLSFARIVNRPKRNIGERRLKFLREAAGREGISLYEALIRHAGCEELRGAKAEEFVSLVEELSPGLASQTVSDLLSAVLERSGYEKMLRTEGAQTRLDNLAELRQSVYDYEATCGEESTLERYLSHVALFTNSDADDGSDKVRLMTVHAAKGLEFPNVFLCGMNEGIFPSRKARTIEDMQEERRLAFVAMTRAEKRLFLSEAEGRQHDGSPRYPSRFLLDIDEGLIEYEVPPRPALVADARDYIAAAERRLSERAVTPQFEPGARVCHAVFGMGTVRENAGDSCVVRFDLLKTEREVASRTLSRGKNETDETP